MKDLRPDVFLAGSSALPVVRGSESTERALATAAVNAAIDDARLGPPSAIFLGTMLASAGIAQRQLAAAVADDAGLVDAEALTLEAACASGAAAVRAAYLAVASGEHDVVVAVGVERMSRFEKKELTRELATASDWEREGSRGATFLSLNAELTERYLARYRLAEDSLFPFARIAHANACDAPHAVYRAAIDASVYRDSRRIEGRLRLHDVAPVCDGSAAIVLASRSAIARSCSAARIRLRGSSVVIDRLALERRDDPLALRAAAVSAERALVRAGLQPLDVDFFELHDAYTVLAAITLESLGFARPGTAPAMAAEGCFDRDGDLPIVTRGGLKARGHPVGATGVYQLAEVRSVLLGEVPLGGRAPRVGLAQSFGGVAATVFTHVVERLD